MVSLGLAHGFIVISDNANFKYKCSDYYNSHDKGFLLWNDPTVNINWPMLCPLLSDKDEF